MCRKTLYLGDISSPISVAKLKPLWRPAPPTLFCSAITKR